MQTLFTLMGNHPHAMPIKQGRVTSNLVSLNFADEPLPHEAFKPFVRELKFDCGELAIATFLQAYSFKKPLVLLPIPISSRFHHGSISYNSTNGVLTPKDIEGRLAGVRTYAQTTGVWVRGILQHEFGVDLNRVNWLTFDELHLAEYRDPSNCRGAPAGKEIDKMLLAGELDAAIPITLELTALKDTRLKTLIPDPASAARDWFRKYGVVSINHWLVARKSVIDSQPDSVRELCRMFRDAKRMLPKREDGAIDMIPFGIERNRKGLEMIVDYAHEQKLIPQRYSVDELFADAHRVLGDMLEE